MTEFLQWDFTLFHLINTDWANPFFDFLLPILRNKYTWMPFYIFLLAFFTINFKKQGLFILIAFAITVGIADSTSSHLIKKSVKRLRPCKVLEQPQDMNLLVKCGSGYSFPSSHAANHFSMAIFLTLVLGKRWKWVKLPLLLWAVSISYAQVYVGVHFPFDVIAGALLGSLIAFLSVRTFQKYVPIKLKEVDIA